MYTTRHQLQSLSMSCFEDVTLLSHRLSTSPSITDTWHLTRFSPQGSVQLVQESTHNNGKFILAEPPFTWPPTNERHVDAIKVLLGVLPDCEGWFLVEKVLRDMFCVRPGEERKEVGRVTEWILGTWQLSGMGKKAALDVENSQIANQNRAAHRENAQTRLNTSSESSEPPTPPKDHTEKQISLDSTSDISSNLPSYISTFYVTLDPITSTIETIRFHDDYDLSSSNIYRIFPGSRSTTRRVRAARAILSTPHVVINEATNAPLPNPPTHKLVELLLRNLPFREVMQHTSKNYAVQVDKMPCLRGEGIRKLGDQLGKDVEGLFPDIVSDFVETRKRAWMSIREEGDRSPGVKKRSVEDEESSEESSEDDGDGDCYDESYTEEGPRRTSTRQRKVAVETASSEPALTETPPKRPSPTTSRPQLPQPSVKPVIVHPAGTLKELTTNIDDSLSRIFRLCREHKALKLKIEMLRTNCDTLREQGGKLGLILDQLEKVVAKRKKVHKQIRNEKARCQREFLWRSSLGFKRVFDQFDTELFGVT